MPDPAWPAPYAPSTYHEDRFSLADGFRDWWQALTSPQAFFAAQRGREGLAAPICFLLCHNLISIALSVPAILIMAARMPGEMAPFLLGGALGGLACASLCGWLLGIVMFFIWAGIVHLICTLFRGQAGYTGTYRAVVYALPCMAVFGAAGGLIDAFLTPSLSRLGASTPGITAPRLAGSRLSESRILLAQAAPGPPGAFPPGFPGGSSPIPDGSSPLPGGSPTFPGSNSPFPGGGPQFPGAPPGFPGSPPGFPGGSTFPGGSGSSPGASPALPGGSSFPVPGPTRTLPFQGQSPVGTVLGWLSIAAYLAVMGVAVAHIHNLSSGQAAGVAVLSGVVMIVLIIIFVVFVAAAVLGAVGAAALGGAR